MGGYGDMEIEGGGEYIKLTAGTVVTVHLLSREPKKENVHWSDRKRSNCMGKVCDLCAEGNKPKQRWIAEIWDRKSEALKKLEFGAMIAGQLKSIAEMLAETQQTIHDVDIRIKTTGNGMETEYSVLHVPMSGEIPQEVKDKFAVPF